MMKEDLGVSKSQAWGCAWNPQEMFKETQASRLGDAPMHPLLHNHQFVPRCTIFLSLHALCAMLGASRSLLFLVCFALFAVVTSQTPTYSFVWERNTLHLN